jgi:aminoglycoside phosphotransferase
MRPGLRGPQASQPSAESAVSLSESLPTALRDAVADRRMTRIPRYAGAPCQLFMLRYRDEDADLILKVGQGLRRELDRLAWLCRQPLAFAVPRPVAFATHDAREYLLMTRIPGWDGSDPRALCHPEAVVRAVAVALRELHGLPVATCPFRWPLDALLDLAEERVKTGALNPSQFPPRYRDRSPTQLLRHLRDVAPGPAPPAVTHGDPSLVNVMLDGTRMTGMIDVGLLGVSDPWRDLAIAVRSITRNLSADWSARFLNVYGTGLDRQRLQFFQILDRFVMDLPAQRPAPHCSR